MRIVNIQEAKAHLSLLIAQVEAGEEIVIALNGEPVAQLVRCKPNVKRQPDILTDRVVIPDSFFDPLPEDELSSWEDARHDSHFQ